jgi:hypothetical protein
MMFIRDDENNDDVIYYFGKNVPETPLLHDPLHHIE